MSHLGNDLHPKCLILYLFQFGETTAVSCSLFFYHLFKPLYGQTVTIQTKADDDAGSSWRDERVMAELLTLVHIADVDLDDWDGNRLDGIMDGHTGVRIGTGIEHDAVHHASVGMTFALAQVGILAETGLMQSVHNSALHIALEVFEVDVTLLLLKLGKVILEGIRAIDTRFTTTQKVQVGTVDDKNFHNKFGR